MKKDDSLFMNKIGNPSSESKQKAGQPTPENKPGSIQKKKKDIWSLFSNVADVKPPEASSPKSPAAARGDAQGKGQPSEANPARDQGGDNGGNGTGLFKNVRVNTAILNEIENITESFKRKNNILSSSPGSEDDKLLSTVLSYKKPKHSDEPLIRTRNVYDEFKTTATAPPLETEGGGAVEVDQTFIKDITSKLKDEYKKKVEERASRYDLPVKPAADGTPTGSTGKSPTAPTVSIVKNPAAQKCVIKKKNICVPVNNEVSERICKPDREKLHAMSRDDKFDIFSNLCDDTFKLVLRFMSKTNQLQLLNRRFCQMLRQMRKQLMYDETLKNTIPPESIVKSILCSPHLEVLDLSGCSHLTAHHFTLLGNSNNIQFSRSLKVLSLRNCNKITDAGVLFLLQRFRNLRTVDLRNCYRVSHEALGPLKYRSSLARLYLGNMTNANVSNNHSDASLEVIFGDKGDGSVQLEASLRRLACLEFTYTKKLTDITHLYLVSSQLKILNLKGSGLDDSMALYFKTFTSLLALNLAETKISNQFLETVMSTCRHLKVLDISKTLDIKNKTVVDLSKNLQALRKIKLAHLGDVDNFCVREILKNCKFLISLDFSNCWRVNNSFANVNGLIIESGSRLRDIGAFQCSVDKNICEGYLNEVGYPGVKIHIYNELKIFETSIYKDLEIMEQL